MRISDWSSDVCSSDLPPHGEGARAELPDHDRPGAGRRRLRPAHPEGLRLFGDGVRGVRRNDQPVDPPPRRTRGGAGEAAREVRRGRAGVRVTTSDATQERRKPRALDLVGAASAASSPHRLPPEPLDDSLRSPFGRPAAVLRAARLSRLRGDDDERCERGIPLNLWERLQPRAFPSAAAKATGSPLQQGRRQGSHPEKHSTKRLTITPARVYSTSWLTISLPLPAPRTPRPWTPSSRPSPTPPAAPCCRHSPDSPARSASSPRRSRSRSPAPPSTSRCSNAPA